MNPFRATLLPLGLLAACAAAPHSAAPGSLAGTSWQLLSVQSMDDAQGTTKVADPKHFTLSFGANGRASLRLDCNRGSGTWAARSVSAESGQLTFGPIAATRAMCRAPHLGERLAQDLAYVRSYLFRDGRLYLSLMADGGIYEWEPVEVRE